MVTGPIAGLAPLPAVLVAPVLDGAALVGAVDPVDPAVDSAVDDALGADVLGLGGEVVLDPWVAAAGEDAGLAGTAGAMVPAAAADGCGGPGRLLQAPMVSNTIPIRASRPAAT